MYRYICICKYMYTQAATVKPLEVTRAHYEVQGDDREAAGEAQTEAALPLVGPTLSKPMPTWTPRVCKLTALGYMYENAQVHIQPYHTVLYLTMLQRYRIISCHTGFPKPHAVSQRPEQRLGEEERPTLFLLFFRNNI